MGAAKLLLGCIQLHSPLPILLLSHSLNCFPANPGTIPESPPLATSPPTLLMVLIGVSVSSFHHHALLPKPCASWEMLRGNLLLREQRVATSLLEPSDRPGAGCFISLLITDILYTVLSPSKILLAVIHFCEILRSLQVRTPQLSGDSDLHQMSVHL